MIPVTKPYFPNINKYTDFVRVAYQNEWLTNRGKLLTGLEQRIQEYLSTNSKPLIMNNGTIPLQIGVKLTPKNSKRRKNICKSHWHYFKFK
jgi:hypothetical protein